MIHLRYGVRWLWLLALYFLIGGVVITTIGAFQYQEKLFKDLNADADIALKQVQVADFRAYYDRHDALQQERWRMLRKLKETLTDAQWVEFLTSHRDVTADNPSGAASESAEQGRPGSAPAVVITGSADQGKLEGAMQAGLQPPLFGPKAKSSVEPGPVKNAVLLVEALETDRKAFNDHLNTFDASTQSEFRNLIYLQRLTWMVPFGPRPLSLATMPPGLLTFIITIAMGALGSLLYVTQYCLRAVIDNKGRTNTKAPFVRPLSWFLFRPLLGVMTALVMFIFIKTGQFSFSDSSLSATLESGLNPYLISFLAILSGFMSWQALEMIERNGKKLFGWQDKRDRWAYGLKQALNMKPAVTEQSLADDLEVPKAQIEKWIAGEQQVNHRHQERIAQILGMTGKDARKLFTDISADGLGQSA